MMTRRDHENLAAAAQAVKALVKLRRELAEALRRSEGDDALGSIEIAEDGTWCVTCLGIPLDVVSRDVAEEGWPDRVEYLFLRRVDDAEEVAFAVYVSVGGYLGDNMDMTGGLSTAIGHPQLRMLVLQYIANALLQSDVFRPTAPGTRFQRR